MTKAAEDILAEINRRIRMLEEEVKRLESERAEIRRGHACVVISHRRVMELYKRVA